MLFFVFWLGLAVLVGYFGTSKGRSGIAWFFVSALISPVIAFIILLVIGVPKESFKKCPRCAENVKVEASVCRFCGFNFGEQRNPEPNPVIEIKPRKSTKEIGNLANWYDGKIRKP